jgi:hypothetical protein
VKWIVRRRAAQVLANGSLDGSSAQNVNSARQAGLPSSVGFPDTKGLRVAFHSLATGSSKLTPENIPLYTHVIIHNSPRGTKIPAGAFLQQKIALEAKSLATRLTRAYQTTGATITAALDGAGYMCSSLDYVLPCRADDMYVGVGITSFGDSACSFWQHLSYLARQWSSR